MRLIDADALKQEFEEDELINQLLIRTYVKGMIDFAPTADAVPVVHGEWIRIPSSDMVTGEANECSVCHKMRFGRFKTNFCPNCGAKMDGGADNDVRN